MSSGCCLKTCLSHHKVHKQNLQNRCYSGSEETPRKANSVEHSHKKCCITSALGITEDSLLGRACTPTTPS